MSKFLMVVLPFLCSLSYGSIVGYSTHPFELNQHVLKSEFASNFNRGAGMGLEVSYLTNPLEDFNFELGAGFTDGDRNSRMFAATTYELFPDFGNQPRVSIKGYIERNQFFNDITQNAVGVAPILSKGFAFNELEFFPFVALPIQFNRESSEYSEMATSFSFGATAPISTTRQRTINANFETNINLVNSFTGVALGVGVTL